MNFCRFEYAYLVHLLFRDDWPGYTPDVVESPNGDGSRDDGKRYAHVNEEDLAAAPAELSAAVRPLFDRARAKADIVAKDIGAPPLGPKSTMRVLYYPPGAGSARHTDFDLFTIPLFRDPVKGFEFLPYELQGAAANISGTASTRRRKRHPGMHMGELWSKIKGDYACPHRVRPLDVEQRSIVFFAMPELSLELPSGSTVGEWLEERIARSRSAR